jgi:hypothetical protein
MEVIPYGQNTETFNVKTSVSILTAVLDIDGMCHRLVAFIRPLGTSELLETRCVFVFSCV